MRSHPTGRGSGRTGAASDRDADWGRHRTRGVDGRTGRAWTKVKPWFVHPVADRRYRDAGVVPGDEGVARGGRRPRSPVPAATRFVPAPRTRGTFPSRCAPPGASRSSAAATQPADPRFRGPSAWRSGSPPGFRPRRRGSRTPAPPADRRECRRAGRPPARMRRPRPRRRRSMQLHAVISCGSWLPWANSLTAWAAPAFSTVSVEKSVKISLRTAEKSLGFKGVLHC